jgi:Fe2+ or Zn2+ uptake regulation protein
MSRIIIKEVNKMLEETINRLKEKGYRITPQRHLIIEGIANSEELLSAHEIWCLVKQTYENIGLDTIYRNLNLLIEMGIIVPITGKGKEGTKYELACDHHHHLICVRCGQSVCLDFCPLDIQLEGKLQQQGYELLRHHLELFGICRKCKKNMRN